ncbi:MAG: protein phosphatase 2C domain-containing protein [Desulfosalsimonadaceae bacterium]|nr:protein phosphatase 2C domain-containing protein [Desulfosalsimonadaceae bacterium]
MQYTVFSGMLIGPRNRQEDCIMDGAAVCQNDRLMSQKNIDADHLLACVCDGLGGHAHGDTASRFVCEQMNIRFSATPSGPPMVRKILAEIQQSAQSLLPENSGATIAGLMTAGHQVVVFNAGDSRVYRISPTGMTRLSHDHSLVQGLVDKSFIHQDTASVHPLKNIVEFGIGPLFALDWNHLLIHVHEETIADSACYLICSDGLSDILTDRELHRLLMPDPIENGKELFTAVQEKGLTDNTSFVILKIQ